MTDAPNPLLLGITEADFQSWRHHPVTKLLLKYVGDFRDETRRRTIGGWEAGSINLTNHEEARARILVYGELIDLKWGDIESFYQTESEPSANDGSAA